MSARKPECQHQLPSSWRCDGQDTRGATRMVCRHCGCFIGYTEPPKPAATKQATAAKGVR